MTKAQMNKEGFDETAGRCGVRVFGFRAWDLFRISGFGFRISTYAYALLALPLLGGCFSHPSAANIELRKQNAQLRDQITSLNRQHDGDQATIAAYQRQHGTVPSLSQASLDRLFTTHGLLLGHMTGGYRGDQSSAPSDGIEVEVVPTDQQGDAIKAAGAFTVEAFDLGDPKHALVGTWHFPLQQSRKMFYDHFTLYTYVLDCPWQHGPPKHSDLTVKVTFDDELTGRQFTVQRQVQVQLAPSTQPGPSATPTAG